MANDDELPRGRDDSAFPFNDRPKANYFGYRSECLVIGVLKQLSSCFSCVGCVAPAEALRAEWTNLVPTRIETRAC